MKQSISDALAWIAFNALLLWLISLLIGLSGYWEIYQQILAFIDTIRGCADQHCSVQLSIEGTPTHPVWLGFDLSIMRELRLPAFLTWFIILVFQSFFIGRFRLWPWQPIATADPVNAP